MPMLPPMLRIKLKRLVALPMRSRGIDAIEAVVSGTNSSDSPAPCTSGGENRERGNHAGRKPVVFLSLVEHELQRADSDGEQADAPVVNPPRFLPDVRRIEDEEPRHDQRRDADRNVDVEHPPPAVVVRQ